MHAPTGEQFLLTGTFGARRMEAVITAVAAGIRRYVVGGAYVTEPFAADATPPFANGIVLVPWPNRVDGGRWMLHGEPQQLDLTEVGKNNAIHGLLRYTAYRATERSESSVTLAASVFPQHGYPFLLDTSVRYELSDGGLRVTHSIRNLSDAPAPVAVGTHPFLRVGDTPVEELTLRVDAGTWFETDERQLPVAEHPVVGTTYDLRDGRRVGDLDLDTAFGDLRAVDGVIRHRLTAPNGHWTELWQEADFAYAQVFTPRQFRRGDAAGQAVAVEPMTAPPNALNSGQGLRWLDPEQQWVLTWGIASG